MGHGFHGYVSHNQRVDTFSRWFQWLLLRCLGSSNAPWLKRPAESSSASKGLPGTVATGRGFGRNGGSPSSLDGWFHGTCEHDTEMDDDWGVYCRSHHFGTDDTLWKTNIAMENHHLQWVNPLKMAIFNSYVKLPEGNIDPYNRLHMVSIRSVGAIHDIGYDKLVDTWGYLKLVRK